MTRTSSHQTEPLLTERQLARILNLEVRTLQAWRLRGGVGPPFLKLGNRSVRYDPQEVRAWLRRRRRASTSASAPPP